MFEEIIKQVAHEMDEVAGVCDITETYAKVIFFSNSKKSKYSYAFYLNDDGRTVKIQSMANGPYLSANAPKFFAREVMKRLKLL